MHDILQPYSSLEPFVTHSDSESCNVPPHYDANSQIPLHPCESHYPSAHTSPIPHHAATIRRMHPLKIPLPHNQQIWFAAHERTRNSQRDSFCPVSIYMFATHSRTRTPPVETHPIRSTMEKVPFEVLDIISQNGYLPQFTFACRRCVKSFAACHASPYDKLTYILRKFNGVDIIKRALLIPDGNQRKAVIHLISDDRYSLQYIVNSMLHIFRSDEEDIFVFLTILQLLKRSPVVYVHDVLKIFASNCRAGCISMLQQYGIAVFLRESMPDREIMQMTFFGDMVHANLDDRLNSVGSLENVSRMFFKRARGQLLLCHTLCRKDLYGDILKFASSDNFKSRGFMYKEEIRSPRNQGPHLKLSSAASWYIFQMNVLKCLGLSKHEHRSAEY